MKWSPQVKSFVLIVNLCLETQMSRLIILSETVMLLGHSDIRRLGAYLGIDWRYLEA